MIQDDLIERLGRSQQKIMSLSVRCRHLEMAEQRARERAEILEELVMDIVLTSRRSCQAPRSWSASARL
jgi:hypothetical protein